MSLAIALFPATIIICLALSAIAMRPPLRHYWASIAIFTLACIGTDAALLYVLPQLGLSFGETIPPLFLISLVRMGLLFITLLAVLIFRNASKIKILVYTAISIQLIILASEYYALYIEPFDLKTTVVKIEDAPQFMPGRPLKILQISDLHIERTTKRELSMLKKIHEVQPDIIVLTGDLLNIDYNEDQRTIADAHDILSQLSAPYGVYAVLARGVDYPPSMQQLFAGLEIRVLVDETTVLSLPGGKLDIVGIHYLGTASDRMRLENVMASVPESDFSLLLYHTPDIIETAARNGVDLYLAGHTHGGQICLPFYGAIVTFSEFGKKYESGRFQVDGTTLYVSRGVGMEGLNMPRARFFCPPELVLVELGK